MIPFQSGAAQLAAVDRQLRDRDTLSFVNLFSIVLVTFLAEVKYQLLQAQAYMKAAHDKQHRLVEFVVRDWVWLCLN
jgi:hypothetical protein